MGRNLPVKDSFRLIIKLYKSFTESIKNQGCLDFPRLKIALKSIFIK